MHANRIRIIPGLHIIVSNVGVSKQASKREAHMELQQQVSKFKYCNEPWGLIKLLPLGTGKKYDSEPKIDEREGFASNQADNAYQA